MPDKQIARPDNPGVERFTQQREIIDIEASQTGSDLDSWIKGKLSAILDAGSFEEINALMTQTGLTAAKTLIGRTFEVQDFAVRESADQYREKSALQKYAIVKAVDVSTGEEFIIDGGGDQFVAGMVAMRERYGFPFAGTLLSMTTGSGNEMQYWRFHDPKREATPVVR